MKDQLLFVISFKLSLSAFMQYNKNFYLKII